MSTLARPFRELQVRRLVGAGIALTGAGVLAVRLGSAVAEMLRVSPELAAGIAASAIAGAATGVGALTIVFLPRITPALQSALLGFSGGLMLAASLLSLIWPAMQSALAGNLSVTAAGALVLAAASAGALGIRAADRILPHLHPDAAGANSRLWLMVVAIALHNLPEGFAVGAGYGGGDALGLNTALAIGLQNLPEGLVVAMALAILGFGPLPAIAIATLTGLAEPLGALAGGAFAGTAQAALPIALAAAGGAMLFVVFHELLPAAIRARRAAVSLGSAIGGIALMAALGSLI